MTKLEIVEKSFLESLIQNHIFFGAGMSKRCGEFGWNEGVDRLKLELQTMKTSMIIYSRVTSLAQNTYSHFLVLELKKTVTLCKRKFKVMYNYRIPFKVGVDTARFDKVYAKQENSMWCWAACLEMIMRHNGINISQDEFAKQSCGVNWQGVPNNCPASFNVLTNYLNSRWLYSGDEYVLSASLNYGTPDLFHVYDELISDMPVIVVYRNRNSSIGHAVLITGIEGYFLQDFMYVTKFIIRDPWPRLESYFTRGRIEKNNARAFMDSISAHWFPSLTGIQQASQYGFSQTISCDFYLY